MRKPESKQHSKQSIPKWWFALAGLALAVVVAYGVQRGGAGAAKESPFNADRAFADLKALVGLGARPAGSGALAKARDYIVAELAKAGLKPQMDEFTARTPRGSRKMVNIRVARPGSNPSVIALAGHYDTKAFDFSFLGANDGGSSAAWVLEMARAAAGLKLQNTLEFIFLDGEEALVEWTDEDSVYGSRYDVDRRYRAGSLGQLKAFILVDMIGDKNLNIRQETESTDWLNSIVWDTARSLGYTREFLNDELTVGDDHVPYLRAGIPAIDIIDFDYPFWHTPADTLDKTSGRSLKVVGDVIYFALPEIDRRVSQSR